MAQDHLWGSVEPALDIGVDCGGEKRDLTWKPPPRAHCAMYLQHLQLIYSCSVSQSCNTWIAATRLPVLHHLLESAQTHGHWVGDAIQPSHPLSSPSLVSSNFPSIRIFFSESALQIRWSKYWSISFSISLSIEYSGLISFRIDWFDLTVIQGTLESLLQHHSVKAWLMSLSDICLITSSQQPDYHEGLLSSSCWQRALKRALF